MKIVLIIAAALSFIGAIADSEKNRWIVLFVASVLFYIAISALGGTPA